MRRLAHHAVYNISITGVIVLSNKMINDIILMRVWRTISSLELVFERGQGRLPNSLVARQQELPCELSKSYQISKNR